LNDWGLPKRNPHCRSFRAGTGYKREVREVIVIVIVIVIAAFGGRFREPACGRVS